MNAIKVGVLTALLGLQGCASLQGSKSVSADPESLTEWSVEGKVEIDDRNTDQQTYFEYKNINGNYELQVRPTSPVGEAEAVIKGTEGDAASVKIVAKTLEAKIMAEKLQSTLTMDNMNYWLRALPATDKASDIKRDKESIVSSMKDNGWEIDYDHYMEVGHYRLPEKIEMSNGDTDVAFSLVRAETGFLDTPCPTNYHPEDTGPASIESGDQDVVTQLVPASGAAPLPRWINDQDFCKQLVKVHGKVPDPRMGLYGPDSMMWKILGPGFPAAMGGGRALLLQIAHPWVTAGVDEHSIVHYDPIQRARRTVVGAGGIVYGSMPQALAIANNIHKSHNEIHGKIPYAAGAFKEGSEYRANEVAAMIWVHATLWDTAVRTYEAYVGPLSKAEKERFNEETKLFAMMFGIPESALPKTWDDFERYVDAMYYSPQLTVTDATRALKDDLFGGFGKGKILLAFPLWVQKTATAATLPTPVREGFDMDYGTWEKLNYQWIAGSVRFTDWVLPDAMRINPLQREAEARLRGERAGWYNRWLIRTGLDMERFVN